MNYKDYIIARDLSWKVLISEQINELPVNMVKICTDMDIKAKLYIPTDDNDGNSTIINGIPYIFVNRNCSRQRQRFTMAHELGHILLGHVGKYKLVNREPSPTDDPIEQAANIFASRLLAPACVLWGCRIQSTEDIAKLCDISLPAAEFRAGRLKELTERDKFLTSPLERKVFEQFKDYITSHRLN